MTLPLRRFAGRRPLAGLTLLAVVVIGSATSTATPPEPAAPARTPGASPQPPTVPVLRHGRYTLVELEQSDTQPDLLQQVVEVSIPSTMNVTVGDALRHLLLYSGYRLCEPSQDSLKLYALPLPAAHLHIGPIVLRDGLLKLVGPAWKLSTDDVTRQVCFTRRGAQP